MLIWISISIEVRIDLICLTPLGLGFGMIYLPSIVSVGYYFERRRALATGVALCGSGKSLIVRG